MKKTTKPWIAVRYKSHVGIVSGDGLTILAITPFYSGTERNWDFEMLIAKEIVRAVNGRKK